MTPKEEFTLKRRRLEALLQRDRLEAVLIRRHDNFAWLTCGGNSVVNPADEIGVGALLLTREGGNFLLVNRIEADRLMDEEGLGALGFTARIYPWMEDGVAGLAEKEVAGGLTAIACDSRFDPCRNLEGDIKKCRYQLTENEVERYAFLGRRLSTAVETAMFALRPGCGEGEISGRIASQLWTDRIDLTVSLIAFDDRIDLYRHPVTTERRLKKRALLSCNARYKGLIATITRLGQFGQVDPDLKRQYRDNVEIECRMIAKTTPGAEEAAVLREAIAAYAEFGHPGEELLHHQGGAMGYNSRDSIATLASRERVAANQAYCWNPTIRGTKSEDGFIVTPTGPHFITGPVCFPTLEMEVGGVRFRRPDFLFL